MPILPPQPPRFVNGSEARVWQLLCDQLLDEDVLLANVRVTDREKDHEADLVVAFPGAGIVVVEVKGGSVWHADGDWLQSRGATTAVIHPVEQARQSRYALRNYVESDPRWRARGRHRVRWAHAVVLVGSEVGEDFAAPDCPRWMVVDRTQLHELAYRLRRILVDQQNTQEPLRAEDAAILLDVLGGRGRSQRDVVAEAAERDAEAQRLTEQQAAILDATRLLHRVEVRGGAGSGKTWLALQQARRLGRDGRRVALLCYSRGLAAHLRRTTDAWPARERPAYVGEFHRLGHEMGAVAGSEDDSDYWENRLPQEMVDLAAGLPDEERFDDVVIDEAQDFADRWWPAVLAALRDDESGGLYVFSDEGQRVFARFGAPPVQLTPLLLDHNLRNTRQIAESFEPLTALPMGLLGGDGPAVRFVECAPEDAMEAGDDAVEALFDDGWRAEDIALLTTGSRHVEQAARQELGQDLYWTSFWDAEQVFYGHVLGFKGLERRAVVLVLNERDVRDRSRERLYVGLSRARDQLVVCGSSAMIEAVAGPTVLRAITGGAGPS